MRFLRLSWPSASGGRFADPAILSGTHGPGMEANGRQSRISNYCLNPRFEAPLAVKMIQHEVRNFHFFHWTLVKERDCANEPKSIKLGEEKRRTTLCPNT